MHLHELFESELTEWFFGRHIAKRAQQLLLNRGWLETTVPGEYKHQAAPEFSIDLDVHAVEGQGPFVVFRHNRKIAQLANPPDVRRLNNLIPN